MADLFSSQRQMTIIDSQVRAALTLLLHRAESFMSQLDDLCRLTLLHKDQIFVFLKRLLNFAPHKVDFAKPKHDAFLDYYVADSTLECHRGHLQVDDYRVRVLTLKEPSSQSFPLIFKQLLEVQANFILCTEWHPEDPPRSRNRFKASAGITTTPRFRCGAISPAPRMPTENDFLIDDSKESLVKELGEGKKEIEIHGHYFGEFSLTVVLYDQDTVKIDKAVSEFFKIFSTSMRSSMTSATTS